MPIWHKTTMSLSLTLISIFISRYNLASSKSSSLEGRDYIALLIG